MNTEANLESDFPALYKAADLNSFISQRRFLTATKVRLISLVIAALFGILTWDIGGPDLAGILATVAFATALGSEVYLLRLRPDRIWYEGRAVAESAKTSAWRFMVGGAPFGKGIRAEREVEAHFLGRLEEIAGELPGLGLVPSADSGSQVTPTMRAARASQLVDRRKLYRQGRIQDQREWYARHARWNEQTAVRWGAALTVVEVVGLAVAVLKASRVVRVDLLGVAAAAAGAGVSWVQAKQHQTLATAYAVASQELASIESRLDWNRSEEEWSKFVDEAEEAISREHTLWRASHSA